MKKHLALALCLLTAACAGVGSSGPDSVSLREVSFAELPGWQADALAPALAAFRTSCTALGKKDNAAPMVGGFAGTVGDWKGVCAAATLVPANDSASARVFFETQFTPFAVSGNKGTEGLFTGYYQPVLKGSLEKKAPYLTPLYVRPSDLVTADLGDFYPELKGKKITARVVDGEVLKPYYKRSDIEGGALDPKVTPIVWVDSAVDAFFLHIQGSGLVELEDGKKLQVGYAAANGHAYHAIGKTLVERGHLTKDNVSMQSIRSWLAANPDQAASVMNLNESYVFFRVLEDDTGPVGAQGVPVTPHRSLAVDKSLIPYSLPLWLDAAEPEGQGRLQRLMIAQDTGGAIKGAVRGDYFWGAGDDAARKAGLMKSRGYYYALLPHEVTGKPPVELKLPVVVPPAPIKI